MALTLDATITSGADVLVVAGTVPDDIGPGFRFRLDDELLRLQSFGPDTSIRGEYARQWAPRDRNRWLVERGVEHSVAASHTQGVDVLAANDVFSSSEDLTPPGPFDGGGGGAGFPDAWTVGEDGSLNVDFRVRATLLHASSESGVEFTAVDAGVAGNNITVETFSPGSTPNVPLTIDVVGTAITVNVATNEAGNQTSTNADVVAAVNLDGAASALVVAVAVGADALWANTGTESLAGGVGSLRLDLDDTGYRVRSPDAGAGEQATVAATVTPSGEEYDAAVSVSSSRGGTAQLTVTNQSVEGTSVALDGRGAIYFFTETGQSAFQAWDDVGNVLRFGLLPAGQAIIGVTDAPADGDLSANQLAFWFDATDGAAKLMLKGKSADGTVVTGSVNLT